jgi:hypothetical protein
MDLKPNFDNFSRPVLFCVVVVGMAFAYAVNRVPGASEYWLSEVPLAAILLIVPMYWHLRTKFWFWTVVSTVVALQAALILAFPVPMITPSSPVLLALVIPSFLILMTCIKFVGRYIAELE